MKDIIISNGIIFMPDNEFHKGTIAIKNGKITNDIQNINNDDTEIINSENLYVIPGLTDIHFHGCKGHDFCEGTREAFHAITDYQAVNGITTICPATMTLPENELTRIMKAAKSFSEECPSLIGINLEGPFISQKKKGAQNPKYITPPDVNMLRRLQDESGGLIKIATVAPETEGAMKFIREAKEIAKISIAHTACDYETAKKAFTEGAEHVTHLFNAMNPINHREPGPVIAALDDDNAEIEIICDGVHIHPAVIRSTMKSFGSDRVIFISDSLEAAGMQDGYYTLGGQKIIKKGRIATLEDGVTIAGSVTNLMECMRLAVREMNIRLEDAVKCSAVNPVKSIGLEDFYGFIKEDRTANLSMLDKELNLVCVVNRGKIIFRRKD